MKLESMHIFNHFPERAIKLVVASVFCLRYLGHVCCGYQRASLLTYKKIFAHWFLITLSVLDVLDSMSLWVNRYATLH